MDPAALGNSEWADIGKLLTNLWIVVALIVFIATNILVGHIFIPSLVATHDLPASVQKTRPLFYAVAIISLGIAIYVFSVVVDLADVLSRFYDIYWIDSGTDR